jgi:DNA-3-methyladenine glycosylase
MDCQVTPMIAQRSLFEGSALGVARGLLGMVLVHGEARARIVETEAYVGAHDLACHAARGRTARTEVLFGPPGLAYVYLIYGMYHCLNVVTGPEGHAAAVLIRAAEPLGEGLGALDGPGKLCRALAIDRSFNRIDLCDPRSPLRLEQGDGSRLRIARGPRVGVDYAGSWAARPYRFMVAGSPFGSRPRLGTKVRPRGGH